MDADRNEPLRQSKLNFPNANRNEHPKAKSNFSLQGQVLWRGIFHVVTWTIWKERNLRIFEGIGMSQQEVLLKIKETVWNWAIREPCVSDTRLENVLFEWEATLGLV